MNVTRHTKLVKTDGDEEVEAMVLSQEKDSVVLYEFNITARAARNRRDAITFLFYRVHHADIERSSFCKRRSVLKVPESECSIGKADVELDTNGMDVELYVKGCRKRKLIWTIRVEQSEQEVCNYGKTKTASPSESKRSNRCSA